MPLFQKLLWGRAPLVLAVLTVSGAVAGAALLWNRQLAGLISCVSAGQVPPWDMIGRAIALMLLSGGAAYGKAVLTGYCCESMSHDLRMSYARRFAGLPPEEAAGVSLGKQLSRLQNEIGEVSNYLSGNLFPVVNECIMFAATVGWMLSLDAGLTLACILPSLLVMLYVLLSSKYIQTAVEQSQEAKGRMNAATETLLSLFPVIRLYDAVKISDRRYQAEEARWERITVRAERLKARLLSLSAVVSFLPLLATLWAGGGMTIDGTITVGILYVFINLSGNVSGTLRNMPQFIAEFRRASGNLRRLGSQL